MVILGFRTFLRKWVLGDPAAVSQADVTKDYLNPTRDSSVGRATAMFLWKR